MLTRTDSIDVETLEQVSLKTAEVAIDSVDDLDSLVTLTYLTFASSHRPEHVEAALDQTLSELGLEYLDVFDPDPNLACSPEELTDVQSSILSTGLWPLRRPLMTICSLSRRTRPEKLRSTKVCPLLTLGKVCNR